jgi:hypothetical protein
MRLQIFFLASLLIAGLVATANAASRSANGTDVADIAAGVTEGLLQFFRQHPKSSNPETLVPISKISFSSSLTADQNKLERFSHVRFSKLILYSKGSARAYP